MPADHPRRDPSLSLQIGKSSPNPGQSSQVRGNAPVNPSYQLMIMPARAYGSSWHNHAYATLMGGPFGGCFSALRSSASPFGGVTFTNAAVSTAAPRPPRMLIFNGSPRPSACQVSGASPRLVAQPPIGQDWKPATGSSGPRLPRGWTARRRHKRPLGLSVQCGIAAQW